MLKESYVEEVKDGKDALQLEGKEKLKRFHEMMNVGKESNDLDSQQIEPPKTKKLREDSIEVELESEVKTEPYRFEDDMEESPKELVGFGETTSDVKQESYVFEDETLVTSKTALVYTLNKGVDQQAAATLEPLTANQQDEHFDPPADIASEEYPFLKKFKINVVRLTHGDIEKLSKPTSENFNAKEKALSRRRKRDIKTIEQSSTKCSVCNRAYLPSYITIHIESVHKKIKRFSCDSCPYQSYFKYNLQKHMKLHKE